MTKVTSPSYHDGLPPGWNVQNSGMANEGVTGNAPLSSIPGTDLSSLVPKVQTQTAAAVPIFSITPNQSSTPSPFGSVITTGTFGSSPAVTESIFSQGYNPPGLSGYSASDYSGYFAVLPDCGDSVALQMQWSVIFPDGSAFKPISSVIKRDGTKAIKTTIDTSGTGGNFVVAAAGVSQFQIASGNITCSLPLYAQARFAHQGTTLGFYNVSPVSQQANGGVTANYTPGSSTAVTIDGTFKGSTGSRGYTIGDIVTALKAYGLIA